MAKNNKPVEKSTPGAEENTTGTETKPVVVETGKENKETEKTQSKPAEGAFLKKANELLKAFGRDVIFRCPKTGQWFTNEGYADTYQKERNIKLEVYRK